MMTSSTHPSMPRHVRLIILLYLTHYPSLISTLSSLANHTLTEFRTSKTLGQASREQLGISSSFTGRRLHSKMGLDLPGIGSLFIMILLRS
ncbi:hypothetical protein JAAARDRAFT_316527 [Jaapia argillacea MUCL 33604]|uniref:Uncharacterized protein n=1 Tax=Jaapia argillacea MUCL 33604 TaxID=933084 RepID=A0A067PXJ6_9AGAM|nr:hypothetical protein JAAARDRAFT_316527 [Jaapia argillacea MUCL 33604]